MIDTLEDRFKIPSGWITGSFTNPSSQHTIHYASVKPQEPPKAIIIWLGGLSEFSEKYYEIAHDSLKRGYAFCTMDWAYQGRSSRLPGKLSHRRHSDGYASDISDLHKFVTDYVLPSNTNSAPVILMAHSMGANIALRYLIEYPDVIKAAAFSAPFIAIKKFSGAEKILLHILTPLFPKSYIPFGKDWQQSWRKSDGTGLFSSDPVRDKLHNAYCLSDKILQVGQPTLAWVYESLKSCAILLTPGTMEKISIPVLVAMAGEDEIVSNDAIIQTTKRIPNHVLLNIENARHEILMEADAYRGRFFEAFDKLLEENKITDNNAV